MTKKSKVSLEDMWEQQYSFMKLLQEKRNFPEFPADITSKIGQQFLEGISFHIMKELFESIQHLRNAKNHRITEFKEVDKKAYLEELVDVQHLLFEQLIASGITLDEYREAYISKGNVNVKRINEGY